MKLLGDGLLKEAQEAEYIIADIMQAEETEGKKKRGQQRSANEHLAKKKCEDFLESVYNEIGIGLL